MTDVPSTAASKSRDDGQCDAEWKDGQQILKCYKFPGHQGKHSFDR